MKMVLRRAAPDAIHIMTFGAKGIGSASRRRRPSRLLHRRSDMVGIRVVGIFKGRSPTLRASRRFPVLLRTVRRERARLVLFLVVLRPR